MNEPKRYSDDSAGAVTGVLLRSMRSDRPSHTSRHKTLVALGLASATTTVSAAAAAQGASALASSTAGAKASTASLVVILKWLAIGMMAGGATIGGVTAIQGRRPAPQEATLAASVSISAARPLPVVPRSSGEATLQAPVSSSESVPHNLPAQRSEPSSSRPSTSASAVASSSPSAEPPAVLLRPPAAALGEEVAALDRVKAFVAAGASDKALRELEAYQAAFPKGRLHSEAALLRAQALLLRGDRAGAARVARDVAASEPRTPLLPQLQQVIDQAEGQGAKKP